MNQFKEKIVSQILFGILLAIFFAIIALIVGMGIGGNYGCLPVIDKIFGTRGYESCGAFGGVLGMVVGSIVGSYLFGILPIKNYRRIMWILMGLVGLPVVLYSVSVLSGDNYSGSVLVFWRDLLKLFGIPAVVSAGATWFFNRKNFH